MLTSEAGAERIRARAGAGGEWRGTRWAGLDRQRLDRMLLVASPAGRPEEVDIRCVPS